MASLTDDSRGVIYNHKFFIEEATKVFVFYKSFRLHGYLSMGTPHLKISNFSEINALAYSGGVLVTEEKSFLALAPDENEDPSYFAARS